MAIVLNPALSMAASGNLAGICYSRYRGRAVARGAWTGTQTSTAGQLTAQARLATVTRAWGYMTEARRVLWGQFALTKPRVDRLGTVYIPTGYQCFCWLNLNLAVCGAAIRLDPPSYSEKPASGALQLTAHYVSGYTNVKLVVPTFSSAPAYQEYLRAGPFTSQGRHAIKPEYRIRYAGNYVLQYHDYGETYLKWYWFKCRAINSYGEPGNWFEGQVQFV